MFDGLAWNKMVRVGEKSGPVWSRLLTKVHQIFGQCRRPFVLSSALARLSMSRFVQKIFTIKCRSRRKTEQMLKFIGPHFFLGGRPQMFCSRLLARFTIRRLAVWLSSVCWSPSAKPGSDAESRIYIKSVKWRYILKLFVDQTSCRFETM